MQLIMGLVKLYFDLFHGHIGFKNNREKQAEKIWVVSMTESAQILKCYKPTS